MQSAEPNVEPVDYLVTGIEIAEVRPSGCRHHEVRSLVGAYDSTSARAQYPPGRQAQALEQCKHSQSRVIGEGKNDGEVGDILLEPQPQISIPKLIEKSKLDPAQFFDEAGQHGAHGGLITAILSVLIDDKNMNHGFHVSSSRTGIERLRDGIVPGYRCARLPDGFVDLTVGCPLILSSAMGA